MLRIGIGVGLCGVLLLSGCSTAGPFVTGISSDGRGGLVIEKALVEFNYFLGTISNQKTTSTTIYLKDGERQANRR